MSWLDLSAYVAIEADARERIAGLHGGRDADARSDRSRVRRQHRRLSRRAAAGGGNGSEGPAGHSRDAARRVPPRPWRASWRALQAGGWLR